MTAATDLVPPEWRERFPDLYALRGALGDSTIHFLMNKRHADSPQAGTGRHLYFIQNESGMVKIGRSDAPEGRLRQLQTAAAEKLLLRIVCEDYGHIEPDLHRSLHRYRLRGEWFAAAAIPSLLLGETPLHPMILDKATLTPPCSACEEPKPLKYANTGDLENLFAAPGRKGHGRAAWAPIIEAMHTAGVTLLGDLFPPAGGAA